MWDAQPTTQNPLLFSRVYITLGLRRDQCAQAEITPQLAVPAGTKIQAQGLAFLFSSCISVLGETEGKPLSNLETNQIQWAC